MGTGTNIEWAHHTYNPWIGCTKISPACDHCYAAEWDKRYHGGEHWGAGVERHRTSPQTRNAPYRWARHARKTGERPRVFCASLADVFDNEVPREWRAELFRVILDTPELDWLILTKRIGNAYNMSQRALWANGFHPGMNHSLPENVWLGITVVTQDEADRDIPKLLRTPAAVRWLSMEPLLEAIDIRHFLDPYTCSDCVFLGGVDDAVDGGNEIESIDLCPKCGSDSYQKDCGFMFHRSSNGSHLVHAGYGIDWVVAGGESGPGARPMHPDWARSLRDQCAADGVPFLFKQWGDWVPYEPDAQPPFFYSQHGDFMDGHNLPDPDFPGPEWDMDGGATWVFRRVGKKAAGRLLDGVTHDEVPC